VNSQAFGTRIHYIRGIRGAVRGLYKTRPLTLGYFFAEPEESTVKHAVLFIALTALAVSGVAWHTVGARAENGAVEPLMSGYELMEIFFEPYMEQLKESVAAEPDKRRGWQEIYKKSLAIGELTGLNMGRTDQDYMATPEWQELNVASRALTVDISEAAKNKDFAGVTGKYQALVESCNACHTKFEEDTAPVIEP
jgi:hypothetical protein